MSFGEVAGQIAPDPGPPCRRPCFIENSVEAGKIAVVLHSGVVGEAEIDPATSSSGEAALNLEPRPRLDAAGEEVGDVRVVPEPWRNYSFAST